MATTTRWPCHPLRFSHDHRHLSCQQYRLRRRDVAIRAFGRSDIDSFMRRVASGEALRDAWTGANEGIERLAFEARLAAQRIDRKYSVSRRMDSAARAAADRAREIDAELGLGRRWKSFTVDFGRNWPRYRRELNDYSKTPIGRGFTTLFFVWFLLSGWFFRFFVLATWVLPFAAPLLIGAFANNFAIEGTCPACRTQFVGYRKQVIRCRNCQNIVWQPKDNFSRGNNGSSSRNNNSEPDIIDVEYEEK